VDSASKKKPFPTAMPMPRPEIKPDPRHDSGASRLGLNAANFFQAESVGVVMPVLNGYLRSAGWAFSSIGIATAIAGLGALLFQTPAGLLTDRINSRRALFAITCIVVGICFALLPVSAHSHGGILALLFTAGAAQTFFGPVLAALALSLVGHARLNATIGSNQCWNHAGNIAAAVGGILVAARFGLTGVFYAVGLSSALAAASVLLIRSSELNPYLATGRTDDHEDGVPAMALLRQRPVAMLFVAVALFHIANAPILPAVALYVKQLGGSDSLMTATVLTAHSVMVPVSLLAGVLANRWGRKPVMAIAFWALPLRILSYTLVHRPMALVFLQTLDGIGAGIYGVAIVAMAADLTKGKGGFNTLMGLFATALAVGGVLGPLLTGVLIQHLGFVTMFILFAALAVAGALWFQIMVPETTPATPMLERAAA
jgi:MFS family permease